MAAIPKPLNRQQLASFLKDNESIIRFQQLFVQAGETIPGEITVINDELTAINEQLEELEFYVMTRTPC